MDVKFVNKISPKVKREWNDLWKQSSQQNYFNSVHWMEANLLTFPNKNYLIFLFYNNKELLAVVPTVKTRKFGVNVLSVPSPKYCEKSTILIKKNDKLLLDQIFKQLSSYNLYITETAEWFAKCIKSSHPDSLIVVSSVNPFISLNQPLFAEVSNKQKNKIKNIFQKNKQNLRHEVEYGLQTKLEEIYKIDIKSTKAEKEYNIFSDKNFFRLFKNMINISPEFFVADIIYYKDKPIIYAISLIYKSTFHGYFTGYFGKYKKLNPGKLLVFFLLKRLQKEKYQIFDFGRGLNDFKQVFTSKFVLQYDIYLSNNPLVNQWFRWINFFRLCKIKTINNSNYDDYKYLFRKI